MEILRTVKELKNFVANSVGEIGFVPTMGALHAGHESLIRESVSQNDITIVSTFVNPAQFLKGEDFEKYPKNEKNDIEICHKNGVSAIFIPTPNELYSDNEPLILAAKKMAEILEGKTRPGHFDGVLRVLNKLFHLTKAKRAYFGKKDAQQLAIVQNFVKSSFLDLQIIPCEIVREVSGLALSSRNAYLNQDQKNDALALSASLIEARKMILDKEFDTEKIRLKMAEILAKVEIDYIAFVDRNFNEISKIKENQSIILVAAKVGNTRLIDNLWM